MEKEFTYPREMAFFLLATLPVAIVIATFLLSAALSVGGRVHELISFVAVQELLLLTIVHLLLLDSVHSYYNEDVHRLRFIMFSPHVVVVVINSTLYRHRVRKRGRSSPPPPHPAGLPVSHWGPSI